jgi:type IV secretion system protein VirB9
MDFVCGDKEYWVVNGAQNFAYVKPAKEGSRTNLNLVAASGNVYSFVLTERSDGDPDLKLFVELRDDAMVSVLAGAPKFVPAQQLDDFRQQAEIAQAQARSARQAAQASIDSQVSAFRSDYPTRMKFTYRFDRDKKPFAVSAIFHDDRFTYIRANPEETPALYEVKEGKPNLINFQFHNGTYVVDKILDSGYLAIGKERLTFSRQE